MPDAILTADWHLREDTPVCRIDDFFARQWKKVTFIYALQREFDCPVLHAGDLFHHWKPSPYLLSVTINYLPLNFYTVYGQHDLPQHNLELAYKCGINTLKAANRLSILEDLHWGQDSASKTKRGFCLSSSNRQILVWHCMCYQGKKPWPDCTDPMAASLLRKYPQFDLIVTGDNHKSFVEEYEGRLLVNPGSLTRQTADQTDCKPCVYLWYAKTNTVKQIYLPIEKDVITREHLERKEQHNNRIEAFISRLNDDWEAQMSFEDNLEEFRKANNVRESVMNVIYKAIENGN